MRFNARIARAALIRRSRHLRAFVLMTSLAAALHAQQDPPSGSAHPDPYVLHLYARLVELPTMILFRRDQKKITLEPQQITIKLNAEPPFHPASLRMEGNDPLSLAILIDVSGDESQQLSALQKHFSEWVAKSLRPQDRVSIYALDCGLLRTADAAPPNPESLQQSLDLALSSPQTHGTSTKGACGNSIRIRGSILYAMQKLAQLPGRRTLLLFSAGRDSKSEISWPQLKEAATITSVTVFGITEPGPAEYARIQDVYSLAQQSGGFLFSPQPDNIPTALKEIVSLLRSRYILQFPMPESIHTNMYRVVVTVPKFDAVIRPSGIGVPLPKPAVDHPSTDLPAQLPDVPTEPPTPNH